MTIIMTTNTFDKKEDTKTVWILNDTKAEEITEKNHDLYTSDNTLKSFRRAGSFERVERGYTSHGYNVVKSISISPCKTRKIIRLFKFS